jgi:hypothetical protein
MMSATYEQKIVVTDGTEVALSKDGRQDWSDRRSAPSIRVWDVAARRSRVEEELLATFLSE